MSNPLFNIQNSLLFIIFLLTVSVQAQQRNRLGELDVVCRNEIVTHTSVAPDGTLWMATECGEIYRADDIHSPWRILKEGSLGGDQGETFENTRKALQLVMITTYGIRQNAHSGIVQTQVKMDDLFVKEA